MSITRVTASVVSDMEMKGHDVLSEQALESLAATYTAAAIAEKQNRPRRRKKARGNKW